LKQNDWNSQRVILLFIICLIGYLIAIRSLHVYGKRWDVTRLLKKTDPSMLLCIKDMKEIYFILFLVFIVLIFYLYFELYHNVRLVTEALRKMKGKIHEIAGSHITSRVLQVYFINFISASHPLSVYITVLIFGICCLWIERLVSNIVHKLKEIKYLKSFVHIF